MSSTISQAVHGYVSDAKRLLWPIPNPLGTFTFVSGLRTQNRALYVSGKMTEMIKLKNEEWKY